LVLDGKVNSFSHYLAKFLYNAIIWTVTARSRRDLGKSRLWPVEDLCWVLFAKMISTS
jgi:hypothetical protein